MPDQTAHPLSLGRRAACIGLISLSCLVWLTATGGASQLRESAIVRAVRAARPSVVNIRGEKTLVPPVTPSGGAETARRVNGMGTGVAIDPRGYILTNYHVVEGVRQIQVTTAVGKQVTAKLVARDLETDLAVIKIDVPEEMPVVAIGTSSDLMPGETVVAVGNAYGYENTVTRGIISALHRAVQVSDAQFYDDLIQTDASINPGNSGGPLLNIDGEMIGINVAVRAGAQGIGFAIPVDKALGVAARLLTSHSDNTTWHGVVWTDDTAAQGGGLAVASVEKDSPAAQGGLKAGDTITAVGEIEVARDLDFSRAMLERTAGEKIQLRVVRKGRPLELGVTLAEAPQQSKSPRHPTWASLGLELDPMAPKEFRRRHHTQYRGGLTVTTVRPNGPAAEAGFRPGDVLVGMHIWETVSLANVSYILKRPDLANFSPVKFFILRDNETRYGYLPVPVQTAQRPQQLSSGRRSPSS